MAIKRAIDIFGGLCEAARRSDLEGVPRVSIAEQLKSYITDSAPFNYLRLQGNEDIPGFNPKWSFGTPIGISAYPLTTERYLKAIKNAHEYGSDFNNIYIFTSKSPDKILYTNNYSSNNFSEDIDKLKKLYKDTSAYLGYMPAVQMFSSDEHRYSGGLFLNELIQFAPQRAKINSFAGQIFYITRELANQDPVKWSKILMSLGYDGIHDSGDEIIHKNEPEQGCFFGSGKINIIDKLSTKIINKQNNIENFIERYNLSKFDSKTINILYSIYTNKKSIDYSVNFLYNFYKSGQLLPTSFFNMLLKIMTTYNLTTQNVDLNKLLFLISFSDIKNNLIEYIISNINIPPEIYNQYKFSLFKNFTTLLNLQNNIFDKSDTDKIIHYLENFKLNSILMESSNQEFLSFITNHITKFDYINKRNFGSHFDCLLENNHLVEKNRQLLFDKADELGIKSSKYFF